jgi:glycosyltransferase involved in cell wall biosynthesis
VKVITLKKSGRWQVFGFLARLVSVVRRESPDVLHTYMGANLFGACIKPLFPGLLLVWGVRVSSMDLSHYDLFSRVFGLLCDWLRRVPDLIISNSHAGRSHCVTHNYPADRIAVVPNGIDTHRFVIDRRRGLPLRSQWGVNLSGILIGCVARLDPMKGHPVLFRAAALMRCSYPEARFVCIGEGTTAARRELASLAIELGIDHQVIFAGTCGDMCAAYNALDLLVLPSVFGEGFPNVVGEALACGVPCVATDVGDSREVLGNSGTVVPPNDAAMLSEAICTQLIGIRAWDATSARNRICQRFSLDALTRSTEELLNRLVIERRPGNLPTIRS